MQKYNLDVDMRNNLLPLAETCSNFARLFINRFQCILFQWKKHEKVYTAR